MQAPVGPDVWRHGISWDGENDFRLPSSYWSRAFSRSQGQWVWLGRNGEKRTDCPLTPVQPQRVTDLENEMERSKEELAAVKSERDDLREELARVKAEREDLKRDLDRVQSDRDDLKKDLDRVKSERDDLQAACQGGSSSSSDSDSSSGSHAAPSRKPIENPKKRQRRASTALASAEPEEKETKKKHPAVEAFQGKSMDMRAQEFWLFYDQCLRGTKADDEILAQYCLGGCFLRLPDVQHFLSKAADQPLADACWRAFLMVWTGTGGPGGRTIDHLYGEPFRKGRDVSLPLPTTVPPMPAFDKINEKMLGKVYSHVACLVDQFGHGEVFGGDGLHVKFRTGKEQGEKQLLSTWRACASLVGSLKAGARPEKVRQDLFATNGIGPLAAKEIFCYLSMLRPVEFDPKATPWGSGARRGAEIVLGHLESKNGITSQVVQFIEKYGQHTGQDTAVSELIESLPKGAVADNIKHMLSKPSVLCVEVCFCWFQSWLKRNQTKKKAPPSWHFFSRELWPESL